METEILHKNSTIKSQKYYLWIAKLPVLPKQSIVDNIQYRFILAMVVVANEQKRKSILRVKRNPDLLHAAMVNRNTNSSEGSYEMSSRYTLVV